MKHSAPLRVPLCKLRIILSVPAALVAIVPEEYARMIHVAANHFTDQSLSRRGAIAAMPAAEFIQHIEAQFIAGFQEMRVRRVMRHPHGVHVHLFDEPYIVVADLPTQGTPRLR